MIISIDAEKTFDKVQHPFMIKTISKVRVEGVYLNIINEFGKAAGYKVNCQKSKAFLYSNNAMPETEIRKNIPFAIVTRKIKEPGINLTKKEKTYTHKTTQH